MLSSDTSIATPVKNHVRDCASNTNVMQDHAVITTVNTLADRISWARERRGLTQTALAKMAGVSQGTIGNLESGTRRSPRALVSIAMVLGVSPLWLESGKGPRESADSKDAADFIHEFDAKLVASPEAPLSADATEKTIRALGDTIAHLDDRSRRMMGVLLNDLAESPLDAVDIAARAGDIVARHVKTMTAEQEAEEQARVIRATHVELVKPPSKDTEASDQKSDVHAESVPKQRLGFNLKKKK
ncbi:MAG: helix-turn-helix transcriptional regulator [Variovorax sp.]|nr:helix-turn-helix transcriptional regulator [Variovorax sp.]